jgi:Domain of unknown function (DUF4372)/Transposase DDE domain
MPLKGTNIFAQLVDLIDQKIFHQTVIKHNGNKHAKGFTCWEQFVSLMFCHLGKAQSLKEICIGLGSSTGKLSHLGLKHGPKKSTLAYANEHRSYKIFEDTFYHLLGQAQSQIKGKHKFRFKNKLYSMDTTVIDLCLSMFDWARFRRAKGAVKLHMLLDHDGYLPVYAHITDGKMHEIRAAKEAIIRNFAFPKDSFIAFDRGFNDYALFDHWCTTGVWFVTRMKDNATYDVVTTNEVPKNRSIRKDEIILFNGVYASDNCDHELRRIEVWDEEHQRMIVLLTNHLTFGSTTIAAIYKDRWQIEIFFKTIKQSFKIKTFIGTSANAVKIQLWTALISLLLLKMLKAMARYAWSMSNLVAMLRFNLFTYRDLVQWLDDPVNTPPFVPDDQLALF